MSYSMKHCLELVPALFSDERAGRIRGAILPSEYELYRFIRNVTNRNPTWSTSLSACDWEWVTCNTAREVKRLRWGGLGLCGSILWKHTPATIELLDMGGDASGDHINFLSGEVNFRLLPPGLLALYLEFNKFTGELVASHLPSRLKSLHLASNYFHGFINFYELPSSLFVLDVSKNARLQGNYTLSFQSQRPFMIANTRGTMIECSKY